MKELEFKFKDKNNLDDTEIRNTMLPLAVTKPDLYRKLIVVGLVVFYLMAVISYFSDGFLTNYIYLQLGLIAILMCIVSKIYDSLYINTVEEIIDSELAGVVIGFSNKLLILTGENVMDEIETDEIKIRGVSEDEEETFFSKYTSVPFSFSLRTFTRLSTVFRAKRLTDFVTIRSIFPARASRTISLKPSLLFVFVPLIPSSVYTFTNSHTV